MRYKYKSISIRKRLSIGVFISVWKRLSIGIFIPLCMILTGCSLKNVVLQDNSQESESMKEITAAGAEIDDSSCTFTIDFEDSGHIVKKKINFTEPDNITNFINISEPVSVKNSGSDITHDGKAAVFDIKTVEADHDMWWIAGLHFDPDWAPKEYFQYTKRITFDFYSEVEYPLITDDYGFSIEFAFKIKLESGVTDANWVCITVPFGIEDTEGEWKRGTINLDELTSYMFYGNDEGIDGEIIPIDYSLEWMMVGPTWDVDEEIWNLTGKGRFMIDNVRFYKTLDSEIDTEPPKTGSLKVVVSEIKD